MNWLLKIVASNGLKLGVAYALEIVFGIASIIKQILQTIQISDEARSKLNAALYSLEVVLEFLRKLSRLVGSPVVQSGINTDIVSGSDKLRRITETL